MAPGLELSFQPVCLAGLAMTDLQHDDHLILMIDVMNVVRKVIMLMTAIVTVVVVEAGIY